MIVVLSLNTAVDRTLEVPEFGIEGVFRATRVTVSAGGKALNVARTVRRLGAPVVVIGFLGGIPATFIRQSCAASGIEQRWVETEGESRTCVIVTNPDTGKQSVVNEQGPEIQAQEVQLLRTAVMDAVHSHDLVCISGSAPPGVPDDLYATLVTDLQCRGARVLVDTSGPTLEHALEARPWVVTPNYEEATAAFGADGTPENLAIAFARHAEHALLTLGPDGIIHAHAGIASHYRPPTIETRNAVASGDAFAAGFLVGIERGDTIDESIRLGIACGASNAAHSKPEIGNAQEIAELLSAVFLEPHHQV